jgi:hypothetical protein
MTDDLVKRVRESSGWSDPWLLKEAADRIEKLEEENGVLFAANVRLNSRADLDCDYYRDRIEKLEAALRNIAEGDIPRTVKIRFRDDGQSSKHDRCEHGQWFYEDCGCCVEDYARKALEVKDG